MQSFLDVRTKFRERPHQKVCFPAARVVGRNFSTTWHSIQQECARTSQIEFFMFMLFFSWFWALTEGLSMVVSKWWFDLVRRATSRIPNVTFTSVLPQIYLFLTFFGFVLFSLYSEFGPGFFRKEGRFTSGLWFAWNPLNRYGPASFPLLFASKKASAQPAILKHGLEITVYRPLVVGGKSSSRTSLTQHSEPFARRRACRSPQWEG